MTHQDAPAVLPEVEEAAPPPPAPSAPMAEVYDTDRFSVLYAQSRCPPVTNLGLAACFLCAFFEYHSIPYSFLGGWAVYLRGGSRMTTDIDVTIDGDMGELERALRMERRVCIPQTHGQTSIQIFIHTGGDWDPPQCPSTGKYTISADIIIGGHLGTPHDLRLGYGTEAIRPVPVTPHGSARVPVLALFYQLAAKLQAHSFRRGDTTSDYRDLLFLVRQYPEQVWALRRHLNRDQLDVFWADVATTHGASNEYTIYIGHLLGLLEDDDTNATRS